MASEVDICNVALGHLGDAGTVASLDPPEGSAQAEHCARFYPMARDGLLSVHSWGFATKRIVLAQLAANPPGWTFAYTRPADALKVLAIQGHDEPDPGSGGPAQTPHAFISEAGPEGTQIIYCNVPNAIARYVARTEVPESFSPLFVTTLTWQLASMLAGPIIKGAEGRAESKRCAQMAQAYLSQATEHDANQRSVRMQHTPGAISARGGSPDGAGWRR